MRIVLLGAPGSGKGTQAALLEKHLGVPHISTGALFRAAIKEATPLGLEVQPIIERGELVPDDMTADLLAERLSQADTEQGFILDGYPRNIFQAEALSGFMEDMGVSIDEVIQLDVDTEKVIARIIRRATEEGRKDDSREVLRKRMVVYEERRAPLIDYYAELGLLTRVLGDGEKEEVLHYILSVLATNDAETFD